jgi:putative transposase
VHRARLILAAADGAANDAIARQLGLHRQAVCRWRARWHAAQPLLAVQEATDPAAAALRTFVTALLTDAPRCGTPPTFTPEQVVGVVALACEEPQASGYPVSHWTTRDLATEAVKRGLVPTISPRTVGRFLGSGPTATASQSLLAQPQTGRPG